MPPITPFDATTHVITLKHVYPPSCEFDTILLKDVPTCQKGYSHDPKSLVQFLYRYAGDIVFPLTCLCATAIRPGG